MVESLSGAASARVVHPHRGTTATRGNQRALRQNGFPHVQLAYDGLQFDVYVDARDEAGREQQAPARIMLAGGPHCGD